MDADLPTPRFRHVEGFNGRDADDVAAQVSRSASTHSMQLREGQFDGYLTTASVDRVRLIYVRYGTPVLLDVEAAPERLSITVPFGPMRVSTPGSTPAAGVWATAPFVVDQHARALMQPDPRAGALVISTSTEVVHQHFAQLAGHAAPSTGLEFARVGDPAATGVVPSLLTHAWRLVHEIVGGTTDVVRAVESETERLLLDAFLLSMPHSGVAELTRPKVPIGPDAADDARQYLVEHHSELISMTHVARHVGVSVRQLQYLFARRFGQTPSEFLHGVRLAHAHELLTTSAELPPELRPTVATVASAAGFTHLGRFAASYRQRYGRSPGMTLHGQLP